jgi:oxygen-independent coproporphyrinogen III oxidase
MAYSLTQDQRNLYRQYAGLALPRHTSYPIAPLWRTSYGAEQFREDLAQTSPSAPLSLYVHIPYCSNLCYYCACTKEIVPPEKRKLHDPADSFLDGLEQELRHLRNHLDRRCLQQVHLGGGSPTFFSVPQLTRLWTLLTDVFTVAEGAEIAVEIDPRITTRQQLQALRGFGFNRVSLGIQDFDPGVQEAVNRRQPLEVVRQAIAWCRDLGFESINFDLIYGLPFQTLETMERTLAQTIALAPDRIAFYRLAVIPEIFRWQKTFSRYDLPQGDLSLDLNLLAINRFLDAGYEFIGLDHFARPGEALAQAAKKGSLQRNFQGMTTAKGLDLIGVGPSAISMLDQAYAQNQKTTEDWLAALRGDLATERGLRLSQDDRLRRELLQQLYGHGRIDVPEFEKRFGINFQEYFASELVRLETLTKEGIVEWTGGQIGLTAPLGRLLVRVVAAIFDRYLPPNAYRVGLPAEQSSKVG